MQWLSDLIKEITIFRVAGALFITSGVMIFGHHFFPQIVETVPTQWIWLIKTIFIFSLSLLFLWDVPRLVKTCRQTIKQSSVFNPPSKMATEFLRHMAKSGNMTTHLSDVHSKNTAQSMIELLQISKELISKNYVEQVNSDETKLRLTSKGRQYVLKHFPKSSA